MTHRRRREASPTINDSEEDTTDDKDDSYGTASDSSRDIDPTDSADYREDSKNDECDLTGLLAGDEHLPEYYMEMMADLDNHYSNTMDMRLTL
ncbi:hypothetical protein GX51_08125 [Blastomyces parvus]|uniref:Uncharacterized protein n=1 Tax=Blastomyces parvus TaxID=2060905 RepID=A0A2B7WGN9_9EURO|nr:hypothetical protein GX51_08125 [Blastomyces parvus]